MKPSYQWEAGDAGQSAATAKPESFLSPGDPVDNRAADRQPAGRTDGFVKIGYYRLRLSQVCAYKPGRYSKAQYIQKFGYLDHDDPGHYFEVYLQGQKDPILFRTQNQEEALYLNRLFDRHFAPVDWSLPERNKKET